MLAATAVIAAAALGSCDRPPPGHRGQQVTLGGLFSLTGEYAAFGQQARTAMELAVEDVNRYLEGNAAGVRFTAAVEDVGLDPQRALDRARALRDRGVRLLIGPQTSEQVTRLKPFVDRSGMLLVSPTSTAGLLAVPGDNVFRFTPADSLEGVAIAAMMWEDGVRTVVPVWRRDAGSAGLASATAAGFTELGGTVLPGVEYIPDAADFGGTVTALRGQIDRAAARSGTDRAAVYLAAFDEVVRLFTAADADSSLAAVRWYGSDASARLERLAGDDRAAAFAMRAGYPNPVFALDEGARDIWEPLVDRIRTRTGQEPDARALAVYDAVWTVARGYVASGATRDVETLKRAVTTAAATGYGATGWTVLDEAGDRRYGDYDFWAIRAEDGVPRWTHVARYESRTGRLVR